MKESARAIGTIVTSTRARVSTHAPSFVFTQNRKQNTFYIHHERSYHVHVRPRKYPTTTTMRNGLSTRLWLLALKSWLGNFHPTDVHHSPRSRTQVTVSGNGSAAEDSFKITASAPICNGSGSVTLTAKPNYRPRCEWKFFSRIFDNYSDEFSLREFSSTRRGKTQTRGVARGLNDGKLFVCIVSGFSRRASSSRRRRTRD